MSLVSGLEIGKVLPRELCDVEVLDHDGVRTRLGDLLRGPTLLVFLRHFGCVGCSMQVDALAPHLGELAEMGVHTVLVGNGEPEHIAAFVARHRLEDRPATIVTEPTLAAYRAAGFERSLGATVGPRALWNELTAIARGYFPRRHEGDALQQGGALLVDESRRLIYLERTRAATVPVSVPELVDAAFELTLQRLRSSAKAVA